MSRPLWGFLSGLEAPLSERLEIDSLVVRCRADGVVLDAQVVRDGCATSRGIR